MTEFFWCQRCNFRFALIYPRHQSLKGGWTNTRVSCPICENAVGLFKVQVEKDPVEEVHDP